MLVVFFLWLAFPQPDLELWPAKERDDRFMVYVSIDDYHSCINFPDYSLGGYQEWHMGAKEWYLGNDPNVWEVVTKSLAKKTSAVLRFGVFLRPYWERMKIPSDKVFHFWLTEKGVSRMVTALHKNRGHEMTREGNFWYFPYLRGYHLIENCNSFTSSVLIAAGLPMREILGQEGVSMAWQLRRCTAIQNEHLGSQRLSPGPLLATASLLVKDHELSP
ncbi:MAG: hypothetical protein KKB51_03220 [Candidatus Riflebacteria bacterium]|nr:hypothetical protein [Candidatus Riflebacteria bacterium]